MVNPPLAVLPRRATSRASRCAVLPRWAVPARGRSACRMREGLQRTEMIDYPHLEYCGVPIFLADARESAMQLFI